MQSRQESKIARIMDADTQTDKQAGRHIDKQTSRQTDRQTEKHVKSFSTGSFIVHGTVG